MDERLEALLQKLGTESQAAWAVLVQEQAAYSVSCMAMLLVSAAIVFVLGVLVAAIVKRATSDNDSWYIIFVGLFIALVLSGLAASNYVDAQAPSLKLFKSVIRVGR